MNKTFNNAVTRAEKSQKLACDPMTSVWVSASAGTGKTKVLTDRVLSLLVNRADPNKIICLTFTKAAAAEMESRIYKNAHSRLSIHVSRSRFLNSRYLNGFTI